MALEKEIPERTSIEFNGVLYANLFADSANRSFVLVFDTHDEKTEHGFVEDHKDINIKVHRAPRTIDNNCKVVQAQAIVADLKAKYYDAGLFGKLMRLICGKPPLHFELAESKPGTKSYVITVAEGESLTEAYFSLMEAIEQHPQHSDHRPRFKRLPDMNHLLRMAKGAEADALVDEIVEEESPATDVAASNTLRKMMRRPH
jgi:hypothetical protein